MEDNEVRETGATPVLEWILELIKKSWNRIFKNEN